MGSGEACKQRGKPRVCTRGRASEPACGREAMRSARSGWAGQGRPACAVPGVRVQERPGCRREECAGGPQVRGARKGTRASARRVRIPAGAGVGRVRTHPGSPRGRRSDSGSLSSSRLPARLPQRARTGANPGRRRQRHPCSVAGRPPQAEERGAGRGLRRAGATDRSCAAVRARSQEPAARSPARPPSPSLI